MPTNISIKSDNTTKTLSWNSNSASSDIYYNVYASNTAPVDINDARNLIVTRISGKSIQIPHSTWTRYFAVTAIDRYGKESRPLQSEFGEGGGEASISQDLMRNAGNNLTLPEMPSTLDAEYILFESATGNTITSRKYAKTLNVRTIPDGMYIIRSISKKGKSHRLGWAFIRRS